MQTIHKTRARSKTRFRALSSAPERRRRARARRAGGRGARGGMVHGWRWDEDIDDESESEEEEVEGDEGETGRGDGDGAADGAADDAADDAADGAADGAGGHAPGVRAGGRDGDGEAAEPASHEPAPQAEEADGGADGGGVEAEPGFRPIPVPEPQPEQATRPQPEPATQPEPGDTPPSAGGAHASAVDNEVEAGRDGGRAAACAEAIEAAAVDADARDGSAGDDAVVLTGVPETPPNPEDTPAKSPGERHRRRSGRVQALEERAAVLNAQAVAGEYVVTEARAQAIANALAEKGLAVQIVDDGGNAVASERPKAAPAAAVAQAAAESARAATEVAAEAAGPPADGAAQQKKRKSRSGVRKKARQGSDKKVAVHPFFAKAKLGGRTTPEQAEPSEPEDTASQPQQDGQAAATPAPSGPKPPVHDMFLTTAQRMDKKKEASAAALRKSIEQSREICRVMNEGKKTHSFFTMKRQPAATGRARGPGGTVKKIGSMTEPAAPYHVTQLPTAHAPLHWPGADAEPLRHIAPPPPPDASDVPEHILPPEMLTLGRAGAGARGAHPPPRMLRADEVQPRLRAIAAQATQRDAAPGGCDAEALDRLTRRRRAPEAIGQLWSELYKPLRADEVCGNKEQVGALSSWLGKWLGRIVDERGDEPGGGGGGKRRACDDRGRAPEDEYDSMDDDFESSEEDGWSPRDKDTPPAMLLQGPIGSGKTAAVYACAAELGFAVIEINGSDKRTGHSIMGLIGEATQSRGLSRMSASGLDGSLRPTAAAVAGVVGEGAGSKAKAERAAAHKAVTADNNARGKRKQPVETKTDDAKPKRSRSGKRKPKVEAAQADGGGTVAAKGAAGKGKAKPRAKAAGGAAAPAAMSGGPQMRADQKAIILFEEVDTLCADDRGFLAAVAALMSDTKRPIVLTSNAPVPLSLPSSVMRTVKFNRPNVASVAKLISMVCLAQGVDVPLGNLVAVAERARGDIRKALNETQLWLQHARESAAPADTDGRAGPPGVDRRLPLGANHIVESESRMLASGAAHRALPLVGVRPEREHGRLTPCPGHPAAAYVSWRAGQAYGEWSDAAWAQTLVAEAAADARAQDELRLSMEALRDDEIADSSSDDEMQEEGARADADGAICDEDAPDAAKACEEGAHGSEPTAADDGTAEANTPPEPSVDSRHVPAGVDGALEPDTPPEPSKDSEAATSAEVSPELPSGKENGCVCTPAPSAAVDATKALGTDVGGTRVQPNGAREPPSKAALAAARPAQELSARSLAELSCICDILSSAHALGAHGSGSVARVGASEAGGSLARGVMRWGVRGDEGASLALALCESAALNDSGMLTTSMDWPDSANVRQAMGSTARSLDAAPRASRLASVASSRFRVDEVQVSALARVERAHWIGAMAGADDARAERQKSRRRRGESYLQSHADMSSALVGAAKSLRVRAKD